MALETINPFTYLAFDEVVGLSVAGIINHFNDVEPNFWLNTFQQYTFEGSDYIDGEQVRINFNQNLAACGNDDNMLFIAANEILDWGGMAPLSEAMSQNLRGSLNCLDMLAQNMFINLDILYVDRLASITKIYEMWDLNNWVIYDSYCVRGLEWLIAGYWNEIGARPNENQLKLPWPQGRVGTQVPGFPIAGTPRQQRLGFIYGSWLCKAIAQRLNAMEGNVIDWRPYHIEMLAFQLGHEINDGIRADNALLPPG